MNITSPTYIQQHAIPPILAHHHHVLLADQTGTGKTLAYVLPIMQSLKREEITKNVFSESQRPRALILCPNRELAKQILSVVKEVGHTLKLSSMKIVAVTKKTIIRRDLNKNIDIVVATPGSLLSWFNREFIFFGHLRYVVIDEADSLFGKGFEEELQEILHPILQRLKNPKNSVNTKLIMATATVTQQLSSFIDASLPECKKVISPHIHTPTSSLKQEFVFLDTGDRHQALLESMEKTKKCKKRIVFCNSVASCRSTEHFLRENSFDTMCLHSLIPPKQREGIFEEFKNKESSVLVCTDVASRGLDTLDVTGIVMFDFPSDVRDYLHRIGRTARAGKAGKVINLISPKNKKFGTFVNYAVKRKESLEIISVKTLQPKHFQKRFKKKPYTYTLKHKTKENDQKTTINKNL
eukprot:CAMPEP_0174256934 /NCGR_PEP_ID=MMETSP0439-20130205/6133_1 /TAXON_ID=0 /ORGANISM="Stereomyxa ramosa, Strain Chinc5" /LENGTH=409 /DNA_ID=CAMNT_0015339791 /DNA_START=306 /DNA_END=1535 /DNA_ORIENTATION=-